MSDETALAASFVVAFLLTLAVTPLTRVVAVRTSFYDHPRGYKEHPAATPYLGGAAVLAGFLGAALAFRSDFSDFGVVVACAIVLFLVGTFDDRVGLDLPTRVGVQIAAGMALWGAGIGWEVLPGDGANLALTVLWTVGLINAFNLMDNLDGATGTVGAACAAGAGAIAVTKGEIALAGMAFALSGACAGFLPHNLAKPSRIFLGDGGSMPIGFLVATVIVAPPDGGLGWATLLASAPLAGLPILDTTLVVVSRWRRRAHVLTGARDHITHRLLTPLRTERRVALALAAVQLLLCGLAIALHGVDRAVVTVVAAVYLTAGVGVIALLETRLGVTPPDPRPRDRLEPEVRVEERLA